MRRFLIRCLGRCCVRRGFIVSVRSSTNTTSSVCGELLLPQLHLPYLFRESFGKSELDELADRLEGQVEALAVAGRSV